MDEKHISICGQYETDINMKNIFIYMRYVRMLKYRLKYRDILFIGFLTLYYVKFHRRKTGIIFQQIIKETFTKENNASLPYRNSEEKKTEKEKT
jgi:hypothetical protein